MVTSPCLLCKIQCKPRSIRESQPPSQCAVLTSFKPEFHNVVGLEKHLLHLSLLLSVKLHPQVLEQRLGQFRRNQVLLCPYPFYRSPFILQKRRTSALFLVFQLAPLSTLHSAVCLDQVQRSAVAFRRKSAARVLEHSNNVTAP
jgi:hypothetical protein